MESLFHSPLLLHAPARLAWRWGCLSTRPEPRTAGGIAVPPPRSPAVPVLPPPCCGGEQWAGVVSHSRACMYPYMYSRRCERRRRHRRRRRRRRGDICTEAAPHRRCSRAQSRSQSPLPTRMMEMKWGLRASCCARWSEGGRGIGVGRGLRLKQRGTDLRGSMQSSNVRRDV